MSNWQPIETAPKDGSWILIKTDEPREYWAPGVYVVKWQYGKWTEYGMEPWGIDDPTGWQELPE